MEGGVTGDSMHASSARLRQLSRAFLLALLLLFAGGLALFGVATHRTAVRAEYGQLSEKAARASSELATQLSAAADHVLSLRYAA
jgi:hypothetical protein